MSRAFVKEDVELPERSGRRRSASGLPPGALNLMTEDGAQRLRARLAELKHAEGDKADITSLEQVLESATIVPTQPKPDTVVFGSLVTLHSAEGDRTCRIVGVDEVHLEPHHVSWVSPEGKTLLGATRGQRLRLSSGNSPWWTVAAIHEAVPGQ